MRYIACSGSPETMLAPGVPTNVAHDIAANENDAVKMAKAVVATTMNATNGSEDERRETGYVRLNPQYLPQTIYDLRIRIAGA